MKIAKDCVVTLAYQLVDQKNFVLDDGKEPLVYLHGGYNDLFEKVEKALEGKEINERIVVNLTPEESFGAYDPQLVVTQPRSDFDDKIYIGEQFEEVIEDEVGDDETISYTIKEITPEHVVLDGNHPFAGIDLVFRATIKEVRLATPEEIAECYAR